MKTRGTYVKSVCSCCLCNFYFFFFRGYKCLPEAPACNAVKPKSANRLLCGGSGGGGFRIPFLYLLIKFVLSDDGILYVTRIITRSAVRNIYVVNHSDRLHLFSPSVLVPRVHRTRWRQKTPILCSPGTTFTRATRAHGLTAADTRCYTSAHVSRVERVAKQHLMCNIEEERWKRFEIKMSCPARIYTQRYLPC